MVLAAIPTCLANSTCVIFLSYGTIPEPEFAIPYTSEEELVEYLEDEEELITDEIEGVTYCYDSTEPIHASDYYEITAIAISNDKNASDIVAIEINETGVIQEIPDEQEPIKIASNDIKVKSGDEIKLSVSMEENASIMGYAIIVDADTEIFDIELDNPGSYDAKQVINRGKLCKHGEFWSETVDNGWIIHWYSDSSSSGEGKLFDLKLVASKDDVNGVYPITVSYIPEATFGGIYEPVLLEKDAYVSINDVVQDDIEEEPIEPKTENYTIAINYDGTQGTITADKEIYNSEILVESGETVNLSIVANNGYAIEKVIVDDVEQEQLNNVSLSDIQSNHTIKVSFVDNTKSIEGLLITGIDSRGYVYNGNKITPEINVYDNGVLLKKNTDYVVKYSDNIKVSENAKIIVTGKGNYSCSETETFRIVQKMISDDDIVMAISDKAYTGKENVSKPVIKYGKLTLKEGTDYCLEYSGDPISVGSVSVKITGIGNYTGSKRISYKIFDRSKDITKLYIEPIAIQTYTGYPIEPNIEIKENKTDSVAISPSNYTVEYQNNTDVGTATVLITGKGAYSGYGNAKKLTFKIVQKDIKDAEITVIGDTKYTGSVLKPAVRVVDSATGKEIPSDCYTVSYSNTTNVAAEGTDVKKLPTVKITGKKNYKGKAEQTFTLDPIELVNNEGGLAENLSIIVKDVIGSKKARLDESDVKATVKYGKKTLTKGKDYVVEYEYDNTKLNQTARIKFIGNYSGTYVASFRIFLISHDVVGLNISMPQSTYTYTGQKIIPEITVTTELSELGGSKENVVLVEGKDYKIVASNNVKAADASANNAPNFKVVCMGAYKGTSEPIKFTIAKKEITREDFDITVDDMKYTGGEVKPKVKVIEKSTGKVFASSNYSITYRDNVKISDSKPEVVITGKGNYEGSIEGIHFRIYKTAVSSLVYEKISNVTYTGKQITPSGSDVKIYKDRSKFESSLLKEGQDYILSYDTNTKVGTGKINVTGIGEYGGSKTITFVIVPKWLKWLTH